MEQVIYSILTDESAREPEAIAVNLADQTSAGAPWFDSISEATSLQNC